MNVRHVMIDWLCAEKNGMLSELAEFSSVNGSLSFYLENFEEINKFRDCFSKLPTEMGLGCYQ